MLRNTNKATVLQKHIYIEHDCMVKIEAEIISQSL